MRKFLQRFCHLTKLFSVVRLCISQLRMTNFCNNEALLGLFDSGNNTELPHLLAQSIPRILLEERTVKETANEYMKYTLLAAHRYSPLFPGTQFTVDYR